MSLAKVPPVSRRMLAILFGLAVSAFIVWVLVIGARVSALGNQASKTDHQVTVLTNTTEAQDEALREANRRLREAGEPQVPVPPVPGPAGSRGTQGPTGSTGPTGAPGATGRDGRPPTANEVAAAVTAYCAPRRCVGPAGSDGSDGQDGESVIGPPGPKGEPGERGAQGERGPPPTDAQITLAVAAYCAGEVCRGPQGQPGVDGAPGAPGPQGIPGVVGVATDPSCADVAPNTSISLAYDAGTQTITIVCG